MQRTLLAAGFAVGAAIGLAAPASASIFTQTNLVTDDQAALAAEGFAPASFVDPNLINPWGMSRSVTSPFWISNQGSATSTLYNGAGALFPIGAPLVVSIPQVPTPPAGPTGQVFNGTTDFQLLTGGKTGPAAFIFANLDGSISAWNGTGTRTQAVQVVAPGSVARPAVYTGLAMGRSGGQNYLYAVNSRAGTVDVYDKNFQPVTLAGGFADPTLPAGLAPFNARVINGQVYVTYAIPGPSADEAPVGSGVVNVFNTDGTFVRRLITGGPLASPWGLAMAPTAGFGAFSGALLVGNFNDANGNINAFDPVTGAFLGALAFNDGSLISIPDLWSIDFGNGGTAGGMSQLFFTGGIGDEAHGLFGVFEVVPEPATLSILGLAAGLTALAGAKRRRSAL